MEHIGKLIREFDRTKIQSQIIVEENTDILLNKDCPYCRGNEYVHPLKNGVVDYTTVIPCSCMKEEYERKRQESLLKYCEIPPRAEEMSFESFEVYPEVKKAFKEAQAMALPGKIVWATFMGLNDTGKTHLAITICKAWIEKGVAAKYVYVPLLLDELREGFKRPVEDGYDVRFKSFCNVPLLLLDDLGTEHSTLWVQEKLETIVDYRFMNNLSLIVTTNKSFDEMSPRLASRLVRHPNAKIVNIVTEDYTLRRNKSGLSHKQ